MFLIQVPLARMKREPCAIQGRARRCNPAFPSGNGISKTATALLWNKEPGGKAADRSGKSEDLPEWFIDFLADQGNRGMSADNKGYPGSTVVDPGYFFARPGCKFQLTRTDT